MDKIFKLTNKYCQRTCCCKEGCIKTLKELDKLNDFDILLFDEKSEIPFLDKDGCKVEYKKRFFCSKFICEICLNMMSEEDKEEYLKIKD